MPEALPIDVSDDAAYQAELRRRLLGKMTQYDRGLEYDQKTSGKARADEGQFQRDAIMNQALQKMASQAGTLNGKSSDTGLTDVATKGMLGSQQDAMEMQGKSATERDRLQQYLMGKMLDQEGALSKNMQNQAELAQKQKADAAKIAFEREKLHTDKVKEEKDLKPDQTAAATYGRRIEQAEKDFQALADKGFDPTSKASAAQRNLPGFLSGMQSEDAKLQAQAERNFVNAVLRRESGSAINASEFASAEEQYFPRLGDTPQVLEQKRRNREIALNGLKVAAGKAWDKIQLPETRVVSGSKKPESGTAIAAPASKPKKVMQNGHEYTLNEKTGEYE